MGNSKANSSDISDVEVDVEEEVVKVEGTTLNFKDIVLRPKSENIDSVEYQNYIDNLQKLITSLTSSCNYTFDHLRYIDLNLLIRVIHDYYKNVDYETKNNYFPSCDSLPIVDCRDYENLILEVMNSDDIIVTEYDINTIHQQLLDSFGIQRLRHKKIY